MRCCRCSAMAVLETLLLVHDNALLMRYCCALRDDQLQLPLLPLLLLHAVIVMWPKRRRRKGPLLLLLLMRLMLLIGHNY